MSATVLVLLAIGAVMAWLAHSWWWPYKSCPACRGRSKKGLGSRRDAKFYNRCRRCKGSSELVRIGARLISKATGKPPRGSEED